jgi:oligoribonuclease
MSFKTFTDDSIIAWTDIETTGLIDAEIVEVGVILTRGHDLDEIARTSTLTRPDHMQVEEVLALMDDFVVNMHRTSGMLAEYTAEGAPIRTYTEADLLLADFLTEHVPDGVKPYLGGSSITFDRSLLEPNMPDFYRLLHYRSIDMTAVSLFVSSALGFMPEVSTGATAHRALGDLEENIAQWRADRKAVADAGASA